MPTEEQGFLPAVTVQRRMGVSAKTINRWLDKPDLKFPPPIVINGRRYWKASDLADWELKRMEDISRRIEHMEAFILGMGSTLPVKG